MRGLALAWLGVVLAAWSATPMAETSPLPTVTMLPATVTDPAPADVSGGLLDRQFEPFDYRAARARGVPFWLRLQAPAGHAPSGVPALVVRKGRHLEVELFASGGAEVPVATELAGFRGEVDGVFVLDAPLAAGDSLYVRVRAAGRGAESLEFSLSTLDAVLDAGAGHSRMIALAFGALAAMSLAALLIYFVLPDRLFALYGILFSLQALYVVYLSGQGFAWPILGRALPLMAHAWNVPAALSGAAACLFVREIAELQRFWPRIHAVFGWIALAFVVLAVANVGYTIGLGGWIAAFGNVMFIGTAVFTLVVAFLSWRRGNRAAGWFLVAWGLLEVFTIATALSFLWSDAEPLMYYGLPLSMVAAAVLVALGVADRLREQRAALTDAERRAQTDSLTGVLNRRSLVERLEAACLRAQARGLPIALLFIDLDHFKEINDSFGHLAGDACLRAVVAPIQAELRHSDVIGRYGGEEFVVILSSADSYAAHAIAERILARVAGLEVEGFGPPIRLTCSIGVATSDALGVWGEHLIARADAAVYAAKSSGRNRVHIAVPMAA